MLETLAFVLVALWLLGLVSSYNLGGLFHILLVVAVVVVLVHVIQGKGVCVDAGIGAGATHMGTGGA
jgi:hypothetical protein